MIGKTSEIRYPKGSIHTIHVIFLSVNFVIDILCSIIFRSVSLPLEPHFLLMSQSFFEFSHQNFFVNFRHDVEVDWVNT